MRNIHRYITTPAQGGGHTATVLMPAVNAPAVCGLSWCMGVWMYDADKAESVFYANLPEGKRLLKENAQCGNIRPFKTKNKKHVVKLTKNILIDMVTTTTTHVLVDWHTPAMQDNQSLQVNRFAFEQWLYETCRLDWCLHDITSHQRAFDTTMSVDNYWLYGDYGVQYGDVVTYIIEHGLATLNCG